MPTIDNYPELVKQWHPTKNGDLKPQDVKTTSVQKAWWQCPVAEDHEWEVVVRGRVNGTGCPCCRGLKSVKSNCLSTTHPELVRQWHPTKNGNLTPKDFTAGSRHKAWWKCPVSEDHEWESIIRSRSTLGAGCPCCDGKKTVFSNCFSTTHPEIAKQWHPTKNGELKPENFTSGSNKKFWFKCPVAEDHEWQTSVSHMVEGGCPCCAGQKVVKSNCLLATHPELSKEWHPIRNVELTPSCLTSGSRRKIWWQCNKGHEWMATVANRTNGRGCPICKESKGESAIAEVLIKNNVSFVREYKFQSCKNYNPLPFDFMVYYKNGIKLIEFQGEQHYKINEFFGGKEMFLYRRKNDNIKRQWCKENGVPLLEIPYWQFDEIEHLIKDYILS